MKVKAPRCWDACFWKMKFMPQMTAHSTSAQFARKVLFFIAVHFFLFD